MGVQGVCAALAQPPEAGSNGGRLLSVLWVHPAVPSVPSAQATGATFRVVVRANCGEKASDVARCAGHDLPFVLFHLPAPVADGLERGFEVAVWKIQHARVLR